VGNGLNTSRSLSSPLSRNSRDLAVDLAVDFGTPGARGGVRRAELWPVPLEERRDDQVGLDVAAQIFHESLRLRVRSLTEIRPEPEPCGEMQRNSGCGTTTLATTPAFRQPIRSLSTASALRPVPSKHSASSASVVGRV